jgi:hypothetical protein
MVALRLELWSGPVLGATQTAVVTDGIGQSRKKLRVGKHFFENIFLMKIFLVDLVSYFEPAQAALSSLLDGFPGLAWPDRATSDSFRLG